MKCVVLLMVLLIGAALVPASSLTSESIGRTQFELTPLPAWQGRDTASAQDISSFFPSDDCCRDGVEAESTISAVAAFAAAPEPSAQFLLLAGLIVIVALKAAGASAGSPGRKPRRR